VGFILTTKSGAVEGKEFVFEDGGEARIGRTNGNDVVVNDNKASRNHARIIETEEGCFIEDLGSANGTFINGEEIQESAFLSSGDVIGIGGGGELVFWDQTAGAPGDVASEGDSTVIKSTEELAAERQAQSALAVASKVPRKPVRKNPATHSPQLVAIPKRANQLASTAQASAAERARKQREAQKSFLGRLHYAFLALDAKKRRTLLISLALTGMVILLGVFFLMHSGPTTFFQSNEPKVLEVGGQPIEDSFGVGKEVKWTNVDSKQFVFHVIAPGKAVAIVRYYAKDISSEEVNILFNSASLGYVPADTLDTREIELVVSPHHIRNNEMNTLMFDNVRNPPEKDTWRIWGISVEIEPVPLFTSESEASAEVAKAIQSAQQTYDAKSVAPPNLYYAWKAYRRAWLIEESLDIKDIREYEFILAKYREIRLELDKRCDRYVLEVHKILNTSPQRDKLVTVLENILQHFPEADHRCHREAKRVLEML